MNNYVTHPIVPSILPKRFPLTSVSAEVGLYILLLLATVGLSVLIGWILTKVMRGKGFKCNLPVTLALSGTLSLLTVLRFGFTLTTVQGILLTFVLLYASCSDLTDHTMDDFLWVMIAMRPLFGWNSRFALYADRCADGVCSAVTLGIALQESHRRG